MERINIEGIYEVADMMFDDIEIEGYRDSVFVGFHRDVATLIKELLTYTNVTIAQISIESEDWSDYDKEYIVTLDSELKIWCEPAYQVDENRYVAFDCGTCYVSDVVNSVVLKKIECDDIYEIGYEFEDGEECKCGCENCLCTEELTLMDVLDVLASLKPFYYENL